MTESNWYFGKIGSKVRKLTAGRTRLVGYCCTIPVDEDKGFGLEVGAVKKQNQEIFRKPSS